MESHWESIKYRGRIWADENVYVNHQDLVPVWVIQGLLQHIEPFPIGWVLTSASGDVYVCFTLSTIGHNRL